MWGSLREAQNQEWEEKGSRSLKKRVMGKAGRGAGGVRWGVGGSEKTSVGAEKPQVWV